MSGRGSVVQRYGKDGSWYIYYQTPEGKKRWECIGPRKKDAERVLSARLEEIRLGKYRELRKSKFAEFADIWVRDYAKIRVKESTLASYESILSKHLKPRFGNLELSRITTQAIQQFVAELASGEARANKSVINILIVLRLMLKHAVRWGYLYENPADHVERPRIEHREMRFLTPDQVNQFLRESSADDLPLFLAAVLTGMRRGELLALMWKDLSWESNALQVERSLYKGHFVEPKSKKSRRQIAMPSRLVIELKKLKLRSVKGDLDLVFCTEEGKALDPDNLVKRRFLPTLRRAGVPRIRFHDLRHTHAALLIAQGESVRFIQEQLGHASAQTTLDRYGHLFPDQRGQAAERLERSLFGAAAEGS